MQAFQAFAPPQPDSAGIPPLRASPLRQNLQGGRGIRYTPKDGSRGGTLSLHHLWIEAGAHRGPGLTAA